MATGRKEYTVDAGQVTIGSDGFHWHYEGTIGTAAVTFDMTANPISRIVYICNDDSTNDLFVVFDQAAAITAAVTNGQNGVFRIKPGAVLSDLPRFTKTVQFIRSAAGGTVRFLGV